MCYVLCVWSSICHLFFLSTSPLPLSNRGAPGFRWSTLDTAVCYKSKQHTWNSGQGSLVSSDPVVLSTNYGSCLQSKQRGARQSRSVRKIYYHDLCQAEMVRRKLQWSVDLVSSDPLILSAMDANLLSTQSRYSKGVPRCDVSQLQHQENILTSGRLACYCAASKSHRV